MIILPMTKSKIEEVEQQIIRDFSSALQTAYVLPLSFSKPTKVARSTYRVSADVVEGKGKFYPKQVFTGGKNCALQSDRGTVLTLSSEYESLGVLFGNNDGEYLFGVVVDSKDRTSFEQYVQKMFFDINTQTGTYEIAEPELAEKQRG